jgi:hypothetical protein
MTKVPTQWAMTLVVMAMSYMYFVGLAVASRFVEVGLTDLTP